MERMFVAVGFAVSVVEILVTSLKLYQLSFHSTLPTFCAVEHCLLFCWSAVKSLETKVIHQVRDVMQNCAR